MGYVGKDVLTMTDTPLVLRNQTIGLTTGSTLDFTRASCDGIFVSRPFLLLTTGNVGAQYLEHARQLHQALSVPAKTQHCCWESMHLQASAGRMVGTAKSQD